MENIQVQQIQASFTRVFARKAAVAERFYHHLFTELPEVKPLFKGDFSRQRDMFEAMLARTVRELTKPGGLQDISEYLIKTHANLQLTDEQLKAGGKAFAAAIEDALGEEISQSEKAAWEEAILRLTCSMNPSIVTQTKAG